MMREAPPIEEAPVARAGPRSPDAFYRGEEAGAAIKLTDIDEAEHYPRVAIIALRLHLTALHKGNALQCFRAP